MIGLPYGEKNYDDMLSRFHLIPERYGRTDRRTDLLYQYRACSSGIWNRILLAYQEWDHLALAAKGDVDSSSDQFSHLIKFLANSDYAVVTWTCNLSLFTSDKEGSTCFCPSACQHDYSKMRAWIWMKCCMSTDIGTWTNWLTFEPDPDFSPDAGTGLLSLISYKRCNAEFCYMGKIPRICIGRPLLKRRVVLKWCYSPPAVRTPLSEVHAL